MRRLPPELLLSNPSADPPQQQQQQQAVGGGGGGAGFDIGETHRRALAAENRAAHEEGLLSQLNKRAEVFLQFAAEAPPAQPIHECEVGPEGEESGGPSESRQGEPHDEEGDEMPTIEMNLVLGVLEARDPLQDMRKDGILLPTKETAEAFDQSRVVEAKRMLGLVNQLQIKKKHPAGEEPVVVDGGDEEGDEMPSAYAVQVGALPGRNSTLDDDDDDDTSSCDQFFSSSSSSCSPE